MCLCVPFIQRSFHLLSLLIEKLIYDCQNISVKLLYVYLCLSSGDLFIKSFHFPFPYFVIFVLWYFPFHVAYIIFILQLGLSKSSLIYLFIHVLLSFSRTCSLEQGTSACLDPQPTPDAP